MDSFERALIEGLRHATPAGLGAYPALLASLGTGWRCVEAVTAQHPGRAPVVFLLHQHFGVAVVDTTGARALAAVTLLRKAFDFDRFRQTRGSLPPVVAVILDDQTSPGEAAQKIRAAFTSEAPLSLTYAEGWTTSLCRAVAAITAPPDAVMTAEEGRSRLGLSRTEGPRWPAIAGIATAVASVAAVFALTAVPPRPQSQAPRPLLAAVGPQVQRGMAVEAAARPPAALAQVEEVLAVASEPAGFASVLMPAPEELGAAQASSGDVRSPAHGRGVLASVEPLMDPAGALAAAPAAQRMRDRQRPRETARQAGFVPNDHSGRGDSEGGVRCRIIVAKVQLGGGLTDDDRLYMRNGCAPRS